MPQNAAHTSRWAIAEVVFGSALLGALVLHWLVPLSLPRGRFAFVFGLAGVSLIVAGVACVVLARRELGRYGQPTDPGRPTGTLVTTGVFSISRNPLYLGAIGVLLGAGLAFNMPWLLVLLVPAAVACHYVLVAPEERYLADRFGAQYRAYAAAVRRWFGRTRLP